MNKGLFILPLLLAFAAPSASAQLLCSDVYKPRFSDILDPHYSVTMKSWDLAWEANTSHRIFGKTKPACPEDVNFTVQDFTKQREFRSWFEGQSRMARRKMDKAGMAPSRATLLPDGREALRAKIMAIRGAKHTIDMSYYIIRADTSGLGLMGELKEAIRRGVNVRIMFDSLGTLALTPHSPFRALIDFAEREGGMVRDAEGKPTGQRAKVEVVEFHALSSLGTVGFRGMYRQLENLIRSFTGWKPIEYLNFSMNRRSHDKILLIDGAFEQDAIAFIGGRNLANEYSGVELKPNETYNDLEVMLKGVKREEIGPEQISIGAQMQEYFDTLYFHIGNRAITRSLLGLTMGYKGTIEKMEDAQTRLSKELELNGDQRELYESLIEDGLTESRAEIVDTFHNIFRPKASRDIELGEHKLERRNSRALMEALEQKIANEKEEVVLISPYLWFSAKQMRLMKKWLLEDPKRKLTIITNSMMTSDNLLAQILVDSVMGPQLMLDPGVVNAAGKQIRRSVADQVVIYERGHLDAINLGGETPYGKLHMKAAYLKSSQTAIVGTFNNDPRSLLLNSEGAAIVQGSKVAIDMQKTADSLIRESHVWGGTEYNQIRMHEMMPKTKRLVAEKLQFFYSLLIKLKLWWLV